MYHNIEEQIPTDLPLKQQVVKMGYYLWYIMSITAVYNSVVLLAVWIESENPVYAGSFFLSLFFALIVIPISLFNYRFLYSAARKQKAAMYVLFMVILWLFQILPCIFFALGIQGMGGAGFITLADAGDNVALIMTIVSACLWCGLAISYIVLFFLARRLLVGAGGVQQARKEAAETAAKEAAKHPDEVAKVAKAVV
jgi:SCAMP family